MVFRYAEVVNNGVAHVFDEETLARDKALKVGVIGLGQMGEPMGLQILSRLSPSVEVYIHSRTRRRGTALEQAGAKWLDSPAEIAKKVDVVLYMVPAIADIRDSIFSQDGLLSGQVQELTVIIGSTVSASAVVMLEKEIQTKARHVVSLLDAPVSGGVESAKDGTLTVFVGGKVKAIAAAKQVLEAVGTVYHLGQLGAGQVAKACNQMLVAAQMAALGEASVLAERAGIELTELFQALQGGYAGSRLMEVKGAKLATNDYSLGGRSKFIIKDLESALEQADSVTMSPRLTNFLIDVYSDVVEAGYGDDDLSVIKKYIEELTG